jgi:Skp family chaperone for outer membrane proteins
MKCFRWCVVFFLATAVLAQTASPTPKKKVAKAAKATITADDVQELKNALAAQQQQIQQLREEMHKRDAALQQTQQQLQQAQAAASTAQTKAEQAASEAAQQQQTVSNLKTDVTDMKLNATNAALSLQETQKNIQTSLENPLALHYKGITITPGGFLAAETVWRSHALGSDINTPFNSIPFDGATASHMSEFFGSGRQSRVSMLAEGKLGSAKASGYVEADFLSAGVTSNNNESNSYTLRQRQAWAQAALNSGWTFTGGQMWSLVTETKKGLDNRTEALPMTIDPQYEVGFSWARQYGFRVTKSFSDKAWLGFSVENSQATLGGSLVSGQNNFIIGSQGTGGGLYNGTTNYSFNPAPDFVAKFAFEPGWGHYEIFGLVSDFRDRVFPCAGIVAAKNGSFPASTTCAGATFPNATGALNNSGWGKGLGFNARGTLAKKVDVGIHFLGGEGIGRYGSAQLPDVVARPDGVLVPVKNFQALGTLEWHSKRLDVYTNVGGEYEARTEYVVGGKGAGYGSTLFNNSGCYTEAIPVSTTIPVDTPVSSTSTNPIGSGTVPNPGSLGTPLTAGYNPAGPPNCSGNTRSIFEGTIGFWYRLYSGPKGRVQWGPQYSYIDRNTWAGKGGNPSATENMILTSFRYYLP